MAADDPFDVHRPICDWPGNVTPLLADSSAELSSGPISACCLAAPSYSSARFLLRLRFDTLKSSAECPPRFLHHLHLSKKHACIIFGKLNCTCYTAWLRPSRFRGPFTGATRSKLNIDVLLRSSVAQSAQDKRHGSSSHRFSVPSGHPNDRCHR